MERYLATSVVYKTYTIRAMPSTFNENKQSCKQYLQAIIDYNYRGSSRDTLHALKILQTECIGYMQNFETRCLISTTKFRNTMSYFYHYISRTSGRNKSSHCNYLRRTKLFTVIDDDMGKKLELLILTRHEDYQELSNKINQVNKQLSVRMDSLSERFAELNQKMLVLTLVRPPAPTLPTRHDSFCNNSSTSSPPLRVSIST